MLPTQDAYRGRHDPQRRRVAATVAAVLVSASCSEEPTESKPSASKSKATESQAPPTPAANGPKISGTGYTYNVPKGWGRPQQKVPGIKTDSLAANLRDSDDFADNVNVVLSPRGELTPKQAEAAAENELTAVGAKDFTVNDRVEVSGSESAHVTAGMSINDKDYTIEQFYPTDNGHTFVVTFAFSSSVTAEDRAKVTDAMLASWAWTD